jgi:prepilin-type N-terminal cleavage/methylation domain-containing protein
MSHQNGFTLVELIVTIVLVGIIGTFTTLFLYTGLNGYLRAQDTAEGALKAQIALDRIALELRHLNDIQVWTPPGHSIVYTSDTLPGVRRIQWDSNAETISIAVDGVDRILLDEVTSYALSRSMTDLNNSGDGNLEVAYIDITFTVGDMGRQFNLRIYPRNMV